VNKARLIYIDEDPEDIDYFQEFVHGRFDLEVIRIENDSELEEVVDGILHSMPDAVISDFMLNEKATVGFNGQALLEQLQRHNKHLPCFLLTSHAPGALEVTHDARLVQSKAIMSADSDLSEMFLLQIGKMIVDYRDRFESAERELNALAQISVGDITAQQRMRAIELDNYIEEHGLSSQALPNEIKDERSIELLAELILHVDQLLEKNK